MAVGREQLTLLGAVTAEGLQSLVAAAGPELMFHPWAFTDGR